MVEKLDYLGDMIRGCEALKAAVERLRLAEQSFSTPDAIAKKRLTIQERRSHLDQVCNRWQVGQNVDPAPLKV